MITQTSILFIDCRVKDAASLLAELAPDVEVVTLDAGQDGLSQMAAALAGRSGISAIHVVSHGAEGMAQLGSLALNNDSIASHAADLATIGKALAADGDILLYGCGTGAGTSGAALVQSLATLTGADVAASSDVTGAANLGGNWILEVQVGHIEAALPFNAQAMQNFHETLATGTALAPAVPGNYNSNQGIALLSNGGHVDVFLQQIGGDNSYYGEPPQYSAKIVVANGANQIVQNLTVSGSDYVINASVAKLVNGGFVVGWSADTSAAHDLNGSKALYYQIYDNAGVPQGGAQQLSSVGGSGVALTALADGGFAAAFAAQSNNAEGLVVYGYDNGVITRTQETLVGGNTGPNFSNGADTNVRLWSVSSSNGGTPSIMQLSDGSIVVTDSVYAYGSPTYTPIGEYAFKYSSAGVPVNFASGYSTQRLNWSYDVSQNSGQHAIALKDGGFAVVSLNAYSGGSPAHSYELMLFNNDGTPINPGDTLTHNVSVPGGGSTTPKTYFAKTIAIDSTDPTDMYGSTRFAVVEASNGKILIALPNEENAGLDIYTFSKTGTALSGPVDTNIVPTPGMWIGHPVLAPAVDGGYALSYDEYSHDVNYLYSGTAYSYGTPYSEVPNTAPAFTGTITAANAAQNGVAIDLATLLHVSDSDSGQTLTWSQSVAPSHGTLTFNAASASSGSANVTPGGVITYTPTAGFAGSDSFTVQVSDGVATVTRVITVKVAPVTPGAPDLAAASDSGISSSDNITNSAFLSFSGTGAAGDSGSTVQVFIDKNGNGSYDPGTDSTAAATMSAGVWTVNNLSTSGLADGQYNVYAITTSATGSINSALSAPFNLTIDKTAPATTFGGMALSEDTGAGSTDFITSVGAQTIRATLSVAPAAGEMVQGSLDNGASWINLSTMVNGTSLAWTGVTLGASGTILLRVVDVAGNVSLSAGQAYTLDTSAPLAPTAPALSTSSDSGVLGDGISNVATPTYTGQGEAYAQVKLYDTDGVTVLGTSTADGLGNWSIASTALSEGTHTLSAKQTDAAGNVSGASSNFSYTLDTVAPSGMALSTTSVPLSGATVGATLATLSATDTTALSYAFATGNGVIDADNGKFAVSGNSLVASQSLAAGTYHIYIAASDAAGNQSLQFFAIDVVDAPGVLSIARAGGASATVPAAPASLSYTVTFSQAVTGVDASDFSVIGSGTAEGTIASVTGSGDTYTVTVTGINGDGNLRLDLNGSGTGIANGSATGIIGGGYQGQSYTLDHTAAAAPSTPVMSAVTDTGTSNSDAITSNTTPVFTGTSEANATVKLYDTDGVTVLGASTADGSGNWSITSSTLQEGSHTLTVKQTDAAGNVSVSSGALAVVIDTNAAAPAAPVLAIASDSGTPGDGITKFATPTITGTAEAFSSVTLYDTDKTTVLGTATTNASGAWSIVSASLVDGVHTLHVKQTDLTGNVSAIGAGLVLTIDTQAPSAPSAPTLAAASDSGTVGDNITSISAPLIKGSADANATVRLYDTNGTTVLGTAVADGAGNWSITSSTLAVGAHTLNARQLDLAGNESPAGATLSLTIETPPIPPAPPPTKIDGVLVTQLPVTLPGGGMGTQTVIPIVSNDRSDSSGNTNVADIPLVTAGANNLLLAQLAPGFGLTTSGGASEPAGNAAEHLIQAILAATPGHPASDQGHLTGNGVTFLNQLAASVPLLVQTIVPTSTPTAPSGALTVTGTSTDGQHTALVIDTSHLAAGSTLVLNAVDFAAIVGSANVVGNTVGQILTGDAASQQFTVSATSGGAVFSGGGNDSLVFNSPSAAPAGDRAMAALAAADAGMTTILHGGQDKDTVVFSGASSDYTVDAHDGYLIVTAKAQPTQHALVLNVESLKFSDVTVAVENRGVLTSIAGLYQSVLGRQADYLGIEYWATAEKNGASLGKIAIDMISGAEANVTRPTPFNGNSAHDLELLYQGIFGRHSDAAGLVYWDDKMKKGMSLEQVAQNFIVFDEMNVHKIAVQDWNFFV
ncbi:Ig-like domain-containing protein [Janthinobacterium sp. HLS12-2]|uniref:Ig-like domain-containing protein n=1 Tax=Janthinobacterium sp. HLS12-2 TaxID=1259324 RepID=UPI003F20E7BB